jgi:hypothetical protein
VHPKAQCLPDMVWSEKREQAPALHIGLAGLRSEIRWISVPLESGGCGDAVLVTQVVERPQSAKSSAKKRPKVRNSPLSSGLREGKRKAPSTKRPRSKAAGWDSQPYLPQSRSVKVSQGQSRPVKVSQGESSRFQNSKTRSAECGMWRGLRFVPQPLRG